MPSTCCVPGCKSNYSSSTEKSRVFKIPGDVETREKWIKRIPRKNWIPGPRSSVCIKHFREEDIIKEDVITKPDGTVIKMPRDRYKLNSTAVPCIFPNLSFYLSDPKISTFRKCPESRRKEIINREEAKIEQFLTDDVIISFEYLLKKSFVKKDWNIFIEDHRVTYYKLEPTSMPLCVLSSFSINKELCINIFAKKKKICNKEMMWLLNESAAKTLHVERYSQIENLISYLDNTVACNVMSLEQILTELKKYIDFSEESCDNYDKLSNLKFFYGQLMLMTVSHRAARRYSPQMISWAFTVFTKSPICYKEIYESGILSVPHERYLRKLTSVLSFSGSEDGQEHLQYLSAKCKKLEQHEQMVNLLLVEIIIRPHVNYTGNSVSGMSVNKKLEKATSVQTFMITSIYSKNKDVVALFPVKHNFRGAVAINEENYSFSSKHWI